MISGILLALARVMGETAPVLVLVGYGRSINMDVFEGYMASLPLLIYTELVNPEAAGALTGLGRRADPHLDHRGAVPRRCIHQPIPDAEESLGASDGQAAGPQRPQYLLRFVPRCRRRGYVCHAAKCHRLHRPVGLRQIDGAAHSQPHARSAARCPDRRLGTARRRGHLRRGHRSGERAQDHRHGVSAAEPIPHHVDSRQRGGRAEATGQTEQKGPRRGRRKGRSTAPTCGTRSRTGWTSRVAVCPAVSSSDCASPAPSPCSPMSC